MKVMLFTDVHWCQYSSIIRSRGDKYSTRLHALINSLNWVEKLSADLGCDIECCLGDFFDQSQLNAEELSALKEINWNNKQHYFLCGNHEMMSHDLTFNSANIFNTIPNCKTINEVFHLCVDERNLTYIDFIPYVLESDRKPLAEYFSELPYNATKITLSHNDIAGIQMGQFISKAGFSLDEISDNCSIFLNGHLHNGQRLSDKAINLGNLCGQNFSEDAQKYDHCAFVLDTDTLKIACYENPYAFNFYKLDEQLPSVIKNNAVVTLSCQSSTYDANRSLLESYKTSGKLLDYRLLLKHSVFGETTLEVEQTTAKLEVVNHLDKFVEYVSQNIGTSDLVKEELQYILN